MMKLLPSLLCVALFATVGFYLSYLIHGVAVRTLIATSAGALAGFGIGHIGGHVLYFWRDQNRKYS